MNQTQSNSATLLTEILENKNSNLFYSFANADGKRWIMPAKNMATAMSLYQPSGIKGKMVKVLFPYLYWCKLVRNVMRADSLKCALRGDLRRLLSERLGLETLEFSIFGGTPCVHQKITIQLSSGSDILGYCKVCKSEEIYALFEAESKILSELRDEGIKNIPQCLYCGLLDDGIGVFLQSTIKTKNSKGVHDWTDYQSDFLQDFTSKTKKLIRFEDSDFYKTLVSLRLHLDWLPDFVNVEIIENAISAVLNRNHGLLVEYAAFHADFTPWNMFVEDNHLFVFDFEYAKKTYPPRLDRYHFFTQTVNFEKHWTVEHIIDYMHSDEGSWINREQYSYYLLDVMSRFTMREKGNIQGDVLHSFEIWYKLLVYLMK